jgi:thiol-disulfide isomerase/thioredoxin
MKTLSILLLLVTALFFMNMSNNISSDDGPIKVIKQNNKELKVYDFEGLQSYFEKSNDTTYVINFWSTWCKPCVKELPHFEELASEMKGEKFKMILVSLDFPTVYENKLIAYLKQKGIESECVVLDDADANAWIPKVDSTWSGAIPATVIYRGENKLFHEGSMTKHLLTKSVKTIMTINN